MDSNFHINYQGFSDPDRDRSILKDKDGGLRISLFCELNRHEEYPSIYTMRPEPYMGFPSAYLIYMYSETEYEAAMKLVGSWTHWLKLQSSSKFMNGPKDSMSWSGLKAWREEKEIKDRAVVYLMLKNAAAGGNVAAQKILFEKDKDGKRGRPSKAEIQKAAKEAAEHDESVKEDFQRIRLIVSNGS